MSWQPLSNNGAFVPKSDYSQVPQGFDAMASWGQPADGGGGGGFDMSTLTDPWQRFQAESMLKSQGLQEQQIDLMGQQSAAPSKWATGAQTFGSVAQGLAGLGNIYLGLQGMKQQKKAFEFNKGVTNTNLNNSIMDYNRRLGDTLANRALNNGKGDGWVSQQLAQYSAKRSG